MSDPASAPLRLALLGAGIFASSAHKDALTNLLDKSRVHIHLVWSRSKASAESLAQEYGSHVIVAFNDPSLAHDSPLASARATLRKHRRNIDAVVLAVPILQLAPFGAMVLSEGLHLLQEKPLAFDTPAARSLLAVPKSPGVVHAVAENFRFEPVFREARTMISHTCGEIVGIRFNSQNPMPPGSRYHKGWRLQVPSPGNLVDIMVHHVAGMRVVLGSDVESVLAVCSRRGTSFIGCDTVMGTMTFENGVSASVFLTYACNNFVWELRVVGSNGDVVVQRTGGKPGYQLLSVKKSRDGTVRQENEIPFSGIDGEFEAFADSCVIGRVHPDLDAAISFNDLAAVEALFESSNRNERVVVPRLDAPVAAT